MALIILNCSVDNPDAHPDCVAEDLSFNDMESIVEIVLEEGIGIKNAIPEHDEPDDDSTNSTVKKTINFYCRAKEKVLTNHFFIIKKINKFFYNGEFSEQFHPEIVPPPPKA